MSNFASASAGVFLFLVFLFLEGIEGSDRGGVVLILGVSNL